MKYDTLARLLALAVKRHDRLATTLLRQRLARIEFPTRLVGAHPVIGLLLDLWPLAVSLAVLGLSAVFVGAVWLIAVALEGDA